jgi:hypothetical protein
MDVTVELLVPGEIILSTHWIGGWVGLGVSLSAMEEREISASSVNRTPNFQILPV